MYDFRSLSPVDFEEFTRDILQAELRVRFESFGAGRDLGIDFRYASGVGHTIVQAKRYVDRSPDAIVRAAAAERSKVLQLSPSRYLFVTAASLSPLLKNKIKKALAGVPLTLGDILGREDLNNLLRRHPAIERQHFKLWLASTTVLERILLSGVYHRTSSEMESIRRVVPKFVNNASVSQAETILDKAGVVIIAGEPGVGKSTLARMLVWLHAEQDWNVYVVDDLKEAFEIAVTVEKRIIFFDDFLGQIQLSNDLVRSTDQKFLAFIQRIQENRNLRLVLTTRSYLFRQAQAVSSRLSNPSINTKQFVLNVGYYTRGIRARILYNHIYFSDMSSSEVADLLEDDFFLEIIDHKNFNPRLIDLLTTSEYLAVTGRPIREVVLNALDNPEQLWGIPYRSHISPEARTLLISLFFNPKGITLPELRNTFIRLSSTMGHTIPVIEHSNSFRTAVKEVEGSALSITGTGVQFSNPGVRDFLRRVVLDDGLLSAIVGAVVEFRELNRCRIEADAARAMGRGVEVSADVWSAAVLRIKDAPEVDVLARLRLVLGIHAHAATSEIVETIDALCGVLDVEEHDASSVNLFADCLEELSSTNLPNNVEDRVVTCVLVALADMIRGYGEAFTIDDFASLSTKMAKLNIAHNPALDSLNAALGGFAENINESISEIDGVGELEEFAEQIRYLLNQHKIQEPRLEMRLQSRLDYLLEREDEEIDDHYSGSGVGQVRNPISDNDQISSMFGSLRER